MGGDPCRIPPGREWAVRNLIPVIPPGLWSAFLSSGEWPAGIQKQLTRSAECHVNDTVSVRGELVAVDIPGFFPWGWYRVPRPEVEEPPPAEEPPGPPPVPWVPPAEEPRINAPRGGGFVTGDLVEAAPPRAWRPPWEGDRVAPGELQTASGLPLAVERRWPATVDMLLPFPFNPGFALYGIGRVPEGAFGELLIRVPGEGHPMRGTGYGLLFADRGYYSDLGHVWRERAEAAGHHGEWCAVVPIFGAELAWAPISPAVTCGPFSASHMWEHRGCFPHLTDWLDPSLSGAPVPWRWRVGGDRPAPGLAPADHDVLETVGIVRGFVPSLRESRSMLGPWSTSYPVAWSPEGVRWDLLAPERPETWAPHVTLWPKGRGFLGDPPGLYLIGAEWGA